MTLKLPLVAGVALCVVVGKATPVGAATFLYGSSSASQQYDESNQTITGTPIWAPHLSLPTPAEMAAAGFAGYATGPMTPNSSTGVVTVVPILWYQNNNCTGGNAPTVAISELTNFYNVFGATAMFNWVHRQYRIPAISVDPAKWFTPPANPPCSQGWIPPYGASPSIEYNLQQEIQAGELSGYQNNLAHTIFAVHLPPDMPFGSPGTGGGYNHTSSLTVNGAHFHWTVVTDSSTYWQNWDSHELLEQLSDPGPGPGNGWGSGAGWEHRSQSYALSTGSSFQAGQQIGDACDAESQRSSVSCTPNQGSCPSNPTPILVENMWSNRGNQCRQTSGSPADGSGSGTSSIQLGGNSSTHCYGTYCYDVTPDIFSNTDRNGWNWFTTIPPSDTNWFWWTTLGHVTYVGGDFDGDGLGDVALVGANDSAWGWCSIPTLTGAGTNAFNGAPFQSPAPSNLANGSGQCFFSQCVGQSPLPPVVGDFNGDGLSDVALVGGAGGTWNTIPIAFSAGFTPNPNYPAGSNPEQAQDNWWVTNKPDNGLNAYVANNVGARPKVLAGDFNGDGLSDLALIGLQSSSGPLSNIVVAFSNRDGTFSAPQAIATYYQSTNALTSAVNFWADQGGVQAVVGDFNGDSYDDIALMSVSVNNGWNSIPVAFSNGHCNGCTMSFLVANQTGGDNGTFAGIAQSTTGVRLLAGDYDGDGVTDLALTGGPNWNTAPIAYSNTPIWINPFQSNVGLFSFLNSGLSDTEFFSDAAQRGAFAISADWGH
jgi:hypothetical protein